MPQVRRLHAASVRASKQELETSLASQWRFVFCTRPNRLTDRMTEVILSMPRFSCRANCGTCKNCLDMPKFGGPNRIRQACMKRKCLDMVQKEYVVAVNEWPAGSRSTTRVRKAPTNSYGACRTNDVRAPALSFEAL